MQTPRPRVAAQETLAHHAKKRKKCVWCKLKPKTLKTRGEMLAHAPMLMRLGLSVPFGPCVSNTIGQSFASRGPILGKVGPSFSFPNQLAI